MREAPVMTVPPRIRPAALSEVVSTAIGEVWDRTLARLDGLGQEEFEWGPPGTTWAVRRLDDGTVRVDWADPDPVPAPVTTIGWRIWHIAVDCLDSYSARLFGVTGSGLSGTAFVADVDEARALLGRSMAVFRTGVAELGDGGLWDDLGPAWGPYATSSKLALALHALDEVAHHGGELGLLRDLYAAQPTD